MDAWPESALLNLGRIMEIWLLKRLDLDQNSGLFFLIKSDSTQNLIDNHQFKLLMNIKDEYNALKLEDSYHIDKKAIKTYFKEFWGVFSD